MNSSIQFLSPLIIVFLVILINNYFNQKNDSLKNKKKIYKYPKLIIYLLYACFALPLLLFFSPSKVSMDAKSQFEIIGISSSLLITILIIYCSKYKLLFNDDNLEFGAFKKKQISYKSIKSVKYHWVNNGQFVQIFMDNGKSKNFEKGVEDFDGFAKSLYEMLEKNRVRFSTVGKARFSRCD